MLHKAFLGAFWLAAALPCASAHNAGLLNLSVSPSAFEGLHHDSGETGEQHTLVLSADADYIYMTMMAPGPFVAVGIKPLESGGSMEGSDIVVCGGGDGDGNLAVQDFHGAASNKLAPTLDAVQDWISVTPVGRKDVTSSAWQQASSGQWEQVTSTKQFTYCEVKRRRTTCEGPDFDNQVDDPTKYVTGIVAWSNKLEQTSSTTAGFRYTMATTRVIDHMRFAEKNVHTAEAEVGPSGDDTQTQTLAIMAPDVIVPQLEGTEICSWHKNSWLQPGVDYHITKVTTTWKQAHNGAQTADAHGMAHHTTLLACDSEDPFQLHDGGFLDDCGAAYSACVVLTGGSLSIKNDEGMTLSRGSGAKSFVFLRHFYNQNNIEGVVDSGTTFVLEYTPVLRPWTLGTVSITTVDLEIPAKTIGYRQQVVCPSECTERAGEMLVTSANVHMHDRGNSDAYRAVVRLIRNGVELGPILTVDNFKEGTQSESWHHVDRTIQPGDEVLFECTYNNPSSVTEQWGAGFYDQMCVLALTTRTKGKSGIRFCMDAKAGGKPYGKSDNDYNAICPSIYPKGAALESRVTTGTHADVCADQTQWIGNKIPTDAAFEGKYTCAMGIYHELHANTGGAAFGLDLAQITPGKCTPKQTVLLNAYAGTFGCCANKWSICDKEVESFAIAGTRRKQQLTFKEYAHTGACALNPAVTPLPTTPTKQVPASNPTAAATGATSTQPHGRVVTIMQSGDWAWSMSTTTRDVVGGEGVWPTITVNAGDIVVFTLSLGSAHNFAIKGGNPQGSGNNNGNSIVFGPTGKGSKETITWVPTDAAEYSYFCTPHASFMAGKLVVLPAPTAVPTTSVTSAVTTTPPPPPPTAITTTSLSPAVAPTSDTPAVTTADAALCDGEKNENALLRAQAKSLLAEQKASAAQVKSLLIEKVATANRHAEIQEELEAEITKLNEEAAQLVVDLGRARTCQLGAAVRGRRTLVPN